VTIGTLNALYAFQGILKSGVDLAEDAAEIEINVLGKPIGKQDHYASAIGGLQLLQFGPGDGVSRDPVVLTADARRQLERSLLVFFTGKQRSAGKVLSDIEASTSTASTRRELGKLRDLALALYEELGKGDPDVLGEYLHRGWEHKRRLTGVSSDQIENWYAAACRAGALGGKLLGAGGGGFMLFYVPRDHQLAVRAALSDLRELPVALEDGGSRITYVGR
jgi:D-glycero-alpha-D-manno-heptose-7-phosphate kinase